MQKLGNLLLGMAIVVLAIGAVGAENFPSSAPVDENFDSQARVPDRSGTPNPLRLTTNDVSWNGSGPVGISFDMNQRARVWIAIYEVGSDLTGPYGPNGAVARQVPQDRFVAVAPAGGGDFEAGNIHRSRASIAPEQRSPKSGGQVEDSLYHTGQLKALRGYAAAYLRELVDLFPVAAYDLEQGAAHYDRVVEVSQRLQSLFRKARDAGELTPNVRAEAGDLVTAALHAERDAIASIEAALVLVGEFP